MAFLDETRPRATYLQNRDARRWEILNRMIELAANECLDSPPGSQQREDLLNIIKIQTLLDMIEDAETVGQTRTQDLTRINRRWINYLTANRGRPGRPGRRT